MRTLQGASLVRRAVMIASATLVAVLAIASASFARQGGGRVPSSCMTTLLYTEPIEDYYYSYTWSQSVTFYPTHATLKPGTETGSQTVRSAVFQFPLLISVENSRIALDNAKIGGICWEDPVYIPPSDTAWLPSVDPSGQPYDGVVKWLYNAQVSSGGGGGGGDEGGGGGGGGWYEICVYEVWQSSTGYIDWTGAILLWCVAAM